MLQLTLITKTKPNQMETRLIELARTQIGALKTRTQVQEALETEIQTWKKKRQKYSNSATRVSTEGGSLSVYNNEGQLVFTIN